MNISGNEITQEANHNRNPGRRTDWRTLSFELFVAFSLFVAFFFLARNIFDYGNPMSANVFMAGSEKLYRLDQPIMGAHWNSRLSGLLMTGALLDFSLNETGADTAQIDRLANVFGLYHACWLLLMFVCIVFALRRSLLINLGIFAGLMYDFSPMSGPNFYPWDMPAMVFFTVAVLAFERRTMWLLWVAVCAGTFFKETVLVCALLAFFADHWKWQKRIVFFASLVAVYLLGKRLLISGLHLDIPMFSMGDAPGLFSALNPLSLLHNLMGNLKVLFLPTFNSVIFANAGSVVAVLVLCWRKRFLPYMTVILAYLAGLVFLPLTPPGITEVRVFMQILPLSFILLSEWSADYAGAAGQSAPGFTGAWAVRGSFPLLLPLALAAVIISTGMVALQYDIIFQDLQPASQAQSPLGKYVYQSEKPVSLEAVTQWFQNGYADSELKLAILSQKNFHDAEAIGQYQRVLDADTNSIFAMNNLAMLLASDPDPRLRDGNRAVRLAQRACELTGNQQPIPCYTLAAAYAEAGQFSEAIAAAEKGRQLALAQGQTDIANANDPLLELYKAGHPFHQQPPPSASQ